MSGKYRPFLKKSGACREKKTPNEKKGGHVAKTWRVSKKIGALSAKNNVRRNRRTLLHEKKSTCKIAEDFCRKQKRPARSLRTFARGAIDRQDRSGLFRRAELTVGFAGDFFARRNCPAVSLRTFLRRKVLRRGHFPIFAGAESPIRVVSGKFCPATIVHKSTLDLPPRALTFHGCQFWMPPTKTLRKPKRP